MTSLDTRRRTRHSRYARHVEPAGGPDPALNAARALRTCIAAYRDLLNDDGYAAVLPAFEVLSAALPQGPPVPAPRTRTDDDHHPMDRGIA